MSKLRQKQRAKQKKPERLSWLEFIATKPHLAKRMECGMPGQMLLSIATWMLRAKTSQEHHREFARSVLPDLEEATIEVFDGLFEMRAQQCLQIQARACDYAWEGEAYHKSVPEILMACLEWIAMIEAAGFLMPAPGSAFDRARKVFQAELDGGRRNDAFAEDYRKAKEAALSIAADMQFRFEEIGLFRSACDALPDEAAMVAAQPMREAA